MTAKARYDRLRERARSAGLRMTPQRDLLLRLLGSIDHHPSAEDLYRRVRDAMPSVSAATVYRNVQTLVQAGVIANLERAGTVVRYDPNPDDHHHFICEGCGSISDVYLGQVRYRLRRGSPIRAADIRGAAVQLHGLCPRCRAR